jgi:hypothetical protein
MAGAYTPKWPSVSDALEYLSFIAVDPRARFKDLQAAVRDREIAVRRTGGERDQALFLNSNLSHDPDPDYVPEVDNRWRLEFVSYDSIDLERVGRSFEVRRDNLIACFGVAKAASSEASAPLKSSILPSRVRAESRARQLAAELQRIFPEGRPTMSVKEIGEQLRSRPGVGKFGDRTLESAIARAWPHYSA